jgi:hypothetical protein
MRSIEKSILTELYEPAMKDIGEVRFGVKGEVAAEDVGLIFPASAFY